MSGFTFQQALSTLGSAQKTRSGVSLYSRFINRPLGRLLAAAAAALGITPNGVTTISALTTAAGLVVLVLANPSAGTGVIVASLLVLGFALDSADGQVARLTGRGNPAGEWLDHVVDAGKMVGLHGAVLIAAFRGDLLEGAWLLLPMGYMFVAVVFFSALTLFELLRRRHDARSAGARAPSLIRALGLLPADYGVLAFSFAAWGWPDVFFVIYGVLLVLTALIAFALMLKWFRTLRDPHLAQAS